MLLSSIRQHILDRAIRGQLVPQLPEEGTAEELFQQIQSEKKTQNSHTTKKPPFNIPKSWKWVKFSQVATIARGGSPRPIKKYLTTDTNGINWIKIGDTEKGGKYINQAHERIIPEGISRSREVHKGDFLLTNSMSYGRPYILNIDGCIHDGWLVFSHYQMAYDKDFLYYLLSSSFAYNQFGEQASGSVVKNLNIDKVANAYFPLPPIGEQERIVRKIEALFSALDSLESSQKRVSAIRTALTKRMLNQAIQGKLVPQLPEEGTAEELYQQIQAEKQRLIAAGTIKKEKPLPPIEEKDLPFDIPETWKWVRLGDCGAFTRGSGIKKNEVVAEGKPCVRYGQLYTTYKTRFSQAVSHVPQELFDKCKQAAKGDILMALTGENKVDIAMAVLYEGEDALAIGGDMTKFSPVRIDPHYFVYTLNSPYGISCKTDRSTGDIIVHTSNDKLSTIPIPLPPLAEQKRIVAKIEELLTLCKSMR